VGKALGGLDAAPVGLAVLQLEQEADAGAGEQPNLAVAPPLVQQRQHRLGVGAGIPLLRRHPPLPGLMTSGITPAPAPPPTAPPPPPQALGDHPSRGSPPERTAARTSSSTAVMLRRCRISPELGMNSQT